MGRLVQQYCTVDEPLFVARRSHVIGRHSDATKVIKAGSCLPLMLGYAVRGDEMIYLALYWLLGGFRTVVHSRKALM